MASKFQPKTVVVIFMLISCKNKSVLLLFLNKKKKASFIIPLIKSFKLKESLGHILFFIYTCWKIYIYKIVRNNLHLAFENKSFQSSSKM